MVEKDGQFEQLYSKEIQVISNYDKANEIVRELFSDTGKTVTENPERHTKDMSVKFKVSQNTDGFFFFIENRQI